MLIGGRRILVLGLGFVLAVAPVEAQSSSAIVPSPNEVGQIIDAALQAVLVPEKELSGIPVAERGVYFDFGQTMKAFGLDGPSQSNGLMAVR